MRSRVESGVQSRRLRGGDVNVKISEKICPVSTSEGGYQGTSRGCAINVSDFGKPSLLANISSIENKSGQYPASMIKLGTIKDVYNVRYMNCPSNKGTEAIGNNWQSVVTSVITSLNSQVSVESADDLKMIISTVPKSVQDSCSDLVRILSPVLSDVCFNDEDHDALLGSYMRLRKCTQLALEQLGSATVAKEQMPLLLLHDIASMFSDPLLFQFETGTLHRYWMQFWEYVLGAVIDGAQLCNEPASSGDRSFSFPNLLLNGQVNLLFGMRQNEVICKPDMVLRIRSLTDRSSTRSASKPATWRGVENENKQLPFCAVKVKTTYAETEKPDIFVRQRSTSCSRIRNRSQMSSTRSGRSQSCEKTSDSTRKDSSQYNTMHGLKGQHFLELLGLVKSCFMRSTQQLPVNKMFGLYLVMNRVYFTCLHIDCTEKETLLDLAAFVNLIGIYNIEKSSQISRSLNMICSNYLDIYKPHHFQAFLMLMQNMVWNEVKYISVQA